MIYGKYLNALTFFSAVVLFSFSILADTHTKADDPVSYSDNGVSLALGDIIPDFTLPNVNGEDRNLYALLEKGPVILSFYRGGWCPICNEQLQSYQADLKSFQKLGAQLVAISPETPDSVHDTAVKNSLEFEVLSDKGNLVARQYGLVWSVPEEHREGFDQWIEEKHGKSLAAYNGLEGYELPIPATFVILQNKTVAYIFRDENYKNRAKNSDIMNALIE